MQLKASFKKELLYFSRSGKLYVILLVPILTMILLTMFYSYADDIVGVTGMTINPEKMGISTEEFGEYEDFDLIKETFSQGSMFTTLSILGTILTIVLSVFLLMGASGKEQKEKAHIIPNSAGLKSVNYVSAKFFIYPIFVYIVNFLMTLIIGIMSMNLFDKAPEGAVIAFNIDMGQILLYAATISLLPLFLVCTSFCIGLSSGKAGIGAISTILGAYLLNNVFVKMGLYSYYPMAFPNLISSYLMDNQSVSIYEIVITIIITLVLCVLAYLISIFFLQSREIRNYEDIPEF
ncbi:MAG: hypothetical protein GX346_03755 [Clostridiales bacterium]|nr:hypothetical protein [Clostridiales bacterium]